MYHKYTKEQSEFIAKNIKGRYRKELTEMFNSHFSVELTLSQITGFIKRNKLKSEIDAQFKIGHASANKGKKGGGWEPTQFKTGNKPHNYLPVGSERVNGDGYVDIKISDPNKWRGKHILVWEKHNGPVTKGYSVIFGDGDRSNFDINNLILVSRQQLLILNKNKLIQSNADLTRTAVIIADINQKINKRKCENQHK